VSVSFLRRASVAAWVAALLIGASAACGSKPAPTPAAGPPAKRFPQPIFDGLSLGMTREEVERIHPIRPTLTTSGKDLRVWLYTKGSDDAVELTFTGTGQGDRLRRFDVHYGPTDEAANAFVARFESLYGPPDVRRREAAINSYGDRTHNQYETIWSDADEDIFLTEREPKPGHGGKPVYYLTVKRREITAKGPPTGYVPPPALDKDGHPIEEPVF